MTAPAITPHLAFDARHAEEWTRAIGADYTGDFTAEQLADILQLNVNVVRRWIREGRLKASRPETFPPSPFRVALPDLRTFLWQMHQEGTTRRANTTKRMKIHNAC